ncbi:hypothetical protein FA13DRAFT_127022 [Coprinellus micaceus]|uniref:Uncharacterized protein n=1 Tax=Coprinellus micaceus TaxID=71717 RepID=A0A4Y7TJ77_COPMI|nr:hypothetical protein FA13DRAFT_127022 [Coprinellus micaceus]
MPPQSSDSQGGPHYVSATDLLVDDSDQVMFVFPEGRWRVQPDTQWYGGTVSSYSGASTGDSELEKSLTLSLQGLSVSFVGVAPTNSTRPFYISFDGSTPTPQTFTAPKVPTPQASTYREWFTTPVSQDYFQREITLYNLPVGVSLDYARVAYGFSTSGPVVPQVYEPSGGRRRLAVDDSDPNIQWANGAGGGWDVLEKGWSVGSSGSRSADVGGEGLEADAYRGTVHASSTVGSSATLYFWGNSVSLYGFLPRSAPSGSAVTVSYRVDKGDEVIRKYGDGSSTSGGDETLQQHFELYGVKGLDDATHMLELNITDIEAPSSSSPPLAFYIDYFTYSTENSPLIQLTSANGVPVNAEFLRKMEVSDVPKAPAPVLGPQYIAAVVILVLSSIIMLWFGRKYLVIALAWLLTLGDKA